MKDKRKRKTHHYAILKMWDTFDKWTLGEYHKYVIQKRNINKGNYYKSILIAALKKILPPLKK